MRIKKELKNFAHSIAGEYPYEGSCSELKNIKILVDKKLESIKQERDIAQQKADEYKQFLTENQMLQSDRIVAEQIQQSMLEKSYPAFAEMPQVDLFADMDPANEIGGDFYDYFKIDDDHVCFSIADVEGKGIPAAMYMAVAKTLIRLRLEGGEKLSEVLSSVNRQLCLSSLQKRFITIWVGILEVSSGKLSYVNAGHNYPVIKRKDAGAEFIKEHSGIPIASYFSSKKQLPPYTEFETVLRKGDILLLYTDGITEAMNRDSAVYGETRLIEDVNLYSETARNMQDFSAYIKRRILSFSNSSEQSDDITLMALKYMQ